MASSKRTVPVMAVVTTSLELSGAVLLTAAGWLAFGLAGAFAVVGGFCLAASWALTRGGGR